MVEHRLIVRDRAGEKILVAGDSTALALPAFDFEDRHTADTDYINQVARELLRDRGDRLALFAPH